MLHRRTGRMLLTLFICALTLTQFSCAWMDSNSEPSKIRGFFLGLEHVVNAHAKEQLHNDMASNFFNIEKGEGDVKARQMLSKYKAPGPSLDFLEFTIFESTGDKLFIESVYTGPNNEDVWVTYRFDANTGFGSLEASDPSAGIYLR